MSGRLLARSQKVGRQLFSLNVIYGAIPDRNRGIALLRKDHESPPGHQKNSADLFSILSFQLN